MMPTQKISDLPVPCSHPKHNPPLLQVFKPGVYKHTCPACGTEQPFVVERLHWVDMPLGTRAHSIGGHWELHIQRAAQPAPPRGDGAAMLPMAIPDSLRAVQPEDVAGATARAAQPEPPPRGDGAEVLPMVIADLQARSEMGRAKYGTTLRVNNGRNALMDAYQESLDQVMYLRQRLEEDRLREEAEHNTLLDGPVFVGMSLAEARIARLRKGNVACSHTDTIRGADIPLRYGSCRSEVCLNCGAFRERDHHDNLRRGAWHPASEYADAIAEQEQD
jgi:hypothetical protein